METRHFDPPVKDWKQPPDAFTLLQNHFVHNDFVGGLNPEHLRASTTRRLGMTVESRVRGRGWSRRRRRWRCLARYRQVISHHSSSIHDVKCLPNLRMEPEVCAVISLNNYISYLYISSIVILVIYCSQIYSRKALTYYLPRIYNSFKNTQIHFPNILLQSVLFNVYREISLAKIKATD